MKDDWKVVVGATVILALLGSLAYVAIAGVAGYVSFLAGPASGWAQAVGSVGAILYAYYAGRRVERQAEASAVRHSMLFAIRVRECLHQLNAKLVALDKFGVRQALSELEEVRDTGRAVRAELLDVVRMKFQAQYQSIAARGAGLRPRDAMAVIEFGLMLSEVTGLLAECDDTDDWLRHEIAKAEAGIDDVH